MAKRWHVELAFVAALGAIFIVMAVETAGMDRRSSLFPAAILVAALLLTVVHIVTLVVKARRGQSESGSSMESVLGDELRDAAARESTIRLLCWLVGYALLVWLVGIVPALAIGTLAYLRFESQESWLLSGVSALLVAISLYAIFVSGLNMSVFSGPIGNWLASW